MLYYYYRESHLKIDHLGSNDNLRDTSIISTLKNGFFNSRHNYFSGNYYLSKYCYYYCPFYQNKGTKSQQRAKGNFKINFQGKFVCFEKKSASQELRFRDSFELWKLSCLCLHNIKCIFGTTSNMLATYICTKFKKWL